MTHPLAIPDPQPPAIAATLAQLHELMADLDHAIEAAQPALDTLKGLGGESMTGIGAECFAQANLAVGRLRHVRDTIARLWRDKNVRERANASLEQQG